MKLLHLESERYSKHTLHLLQQHFDCDFVKIKSQSDLDRLLEKQKYQFIFTRLGLMLGANNLESQDELQAIVTPTTGHNHIGESYCRERGITIISLKGEQEFLRSITSTGEHTMALILTLCRNLDKAITSTKKGNWEREPFLATDLYGRTLGIIGYGRLGKMVAGYAHAFGMHILANDTDPNAFLNAPPWLLTVSLERLLSNADIISLHIPYSVRNERFIDGEKLGKMKSSAFLINTSRGEIIDEESLVKALSNKRIAGAAVDVLAGDSTWSASIDSSNPLFKYLDTGENLIITPHMGGYGDHSITGTRDFITEKFLKKYISQ